MTNLISHAKSTDFILTIAPLPLVTFAIQDFQLPSINVDLMRLEHRSLDFAVNGEKANFDPITISFLVDENWNNWIEIYNLIFNAVHPNKPHLRSNLKFDAHITLLSNNKTPVAKITLVDAIPSSLEGVAMDHGTDSPTSLQSAMTLEFSYMTVRSIPPV